MSNPSPQGRTGTLRMKNQDNSESRHPAATLFPPYSTDGGRKLVESARCFEVDGLARYKRKETGFWAMKPTSSPGIPI